jgi:hypothetical protein
MKRVFYTILFLLLSQSIHAVDLLENFDLRSYSPVKNGLKDFTCQIRIKGLTDQIKKDLVNVKINDEVYYKLYWKYPGKVDITVEGLPKGFQELRQNLKGLVVNRVDYLVPQDLSKRLRAYKLKSKPIKGGTLVLGTDPSNRLAVNKIEIKFDGSEKLKSYKSYSPLGFQQSIFEFGKKSWSKNKWVLESVKAKTVQGPQITEIETEIDYENNVGYGFPTEINIETLQYVLAPGENEKKNERTGETVISFSNYKINSGDAQKYFRGRE